MQFPALFWHAVNHVFQLSGRAVGFEPHPLNSNKKTIVGETL